MAEIQYTKVICKQPNRYIGWPTVDKMPDGELIVAFSGDRDAHVDPFGKTFLIRSNDNGDTWGKPELVNDTPLDDRDTGLCICDDGTLVLSWFTSHFEEEKYMRHAPPGEEDRWREKIRGVTMADIREWAGERITNGRYETGRWIRCSHDRGKTWEDLVRVLPSAPHGPIETSDGRILYLGIDNNTPDKGEGDFLLTASEDKGQTWSTIARIPRFPKNTGADPESRAWLTEPHIVETHEGNLLGMARYEERPRRKDAPSAPTCLWQFSSEDGGISWTQPEPTTIRGKPPHLTKLSGGRILVTYGYRHSPFGERACLSYDNGSTWDYANEIILHDSAPSGDLGYPASIELDNGEILTVYYQQEYPGEKTCLMATRWRVKG